MLQGAGLEYEVVGEGEPVLLVHGSFVAASFQLVAHMEGLASRYRVIRYHRRGFAGSDAITSPFTISDQARDAAALLGRLGIKRAHIVGHSYGGLVALQLAIDAPELVHSLVLIEPAVYDAILSEPGAPPSPVIARLVDRYRSGDVHGAADGFMRGPGGDTWIADLEAVIPGGSEQVFSDVATFFDVENDALNAWTFDAATAQGITQPLLYVIGDGPPERPRQAAAVERMTGLVPQTEGAVIPGVRHQMIYTHPEVVASVLADFVARHPMIV